MLNRRTTIQIIKGFFITILVAGIVSYAIWRSLNYARGPSIVIIQPEENEAIATSTIEVQGKAERIKELTLNGRTISIEESGNFKEILVIFPGINIIHVDARDQFGRNVVKDIRVVGVSTSTLAAASTSLQTQHSK